mmetsp:Transcript_37834/g.74800  ORF Transcript_37834/g.74800 Transcript_37834/m.74800 type:complete len:113 (+) Transcript_37834:285-623(+)
MSCRHHPGSSSRCVSWQREVDDGDDGDDGDDDDGGSSIDTVVASVAVKSDASGPSDDISADSVNDDAATDGPLTKVGKLKLSGGSAGNMTSDCTETAKVSTPLQVLLVVLLR